MPCVCFIVIIKCMLIMALPHVPLSELVVKSLGKLHSVVTFTFHYVLYQTRIQAHAPCTRIQAYAPISESICKINKS